MNELEQAFQKVTDKSAVIGVVGLGYVGLPLVLGFVDRGFRVLGMDIELFFLKLMSLNSLTLLLLGMPLLRLSFLLA